MKADGYRCVHCSATYPFDLFRRRCDCGGSLEIVYSGTGSIGPGTGHWRYSGFYPVRKRVSLGEGSTPFLESVKIGPELGLELFFKFEGTNPTGSFKDRGSAVEISAAIEAGASSVACATTGNMGASVSAYCARAGIRAVVYFPERTPESKVNQIKSYGARTVKVPGGYRDAVRLAERAVLRERAEVLAGDYPLRSEGEKSVAFEIFENFGGVPDFVICPVGNGTLISSIFKAFSELKASGLTDRVPRLIGVQARGCNPIARAFRTGVFSPVRPRTEADAIACGAPGDWKRAVDSVRSSGGFFVEVSDREMKRAVKVLGSEGIYAELSAAAPVAAVEKLEIRGSAVLVITGTGLKRSV